MSLSRTTASFVFALGIATATTGCASETGTPDVETNDALKDGDKLAGLYVSDGIFPSLWLKGPEVGGPNLSFRAEIPSFCGGVCETPPLPRIIDGIWIAQEGVLKLSERRNDNGRGKEWNLAYKTSAKGDLILQENGKVVATLKKQADQTKTLEKAFNKFGVTSITLDVDQIQVARQARLYPGKVRYEDALVTAVSTFFAAKSKALELPGIMSNEVNENFCFDSKRTDEKMLSCLFNDATFSLGEDAKAWTFNVEINAFSDSNYGAAVSVNRSTKATRTSVWPSY